MNLTKRSVEKRYKCKLNRNNGFDNNRLYWEAWDNLTEDYLCDAWTLIELVEKLEKIKSNGKA